MLDTNGNAFNIKDSQKSMNNSIIYGTPKKKFMTNSFKPRMLVW